MKWFVTRFSFPLGIGFAALVTAISANALKNYAAEDCATVATTAGWLAGVLFAFIGLFAWAIERDRRAKEEAATKP